jgi:thymidylate synthase (FAD)
MKVELVSITQPVGKIVEEGIKTADDLVAYIARVSNPSNQFNTLTAPKLIRYLTKHKHWSPFEMTDMGVEIKTSRAIAAQILRHRSFSFQEFSQRYSKVNKFEDIEWRLQGKTNRQVGDEPVELDKQLENSISLHLDNSFMLYDELLNEGVAKECARNILPLTTETTMFMKGSFRSWIHYIDLRTCEDTQKEHRDIALKCKEIFVNTFPKTGEALQWV